MLVSFVCCCELVVMNIQGIMKENIPEESITFTDHVFSLLVVLPFLPVLGADGHPKLLLPSVSGAPLRFLPASIALTSSHTGESLSPVPSAGACGLLGASHPRMRSNG